MRAELPWPNSLKGFISQDHLQDKCHHGLQTIAHDGTSCMGSCNSSKRRTWGKKQNWWILNKEVILVSNNAQGTGTVYSTFSCYFQKHLVLEQQFKSQLQDFLSSSLPKHLERQKWMAQVLGGLPPRKETRTEFLSSGFHLTKSWPLPPFARNTWIFKTIIMYELFISFLKKCWFLSYKN